MRVTRQLRRVWVPAYLVHCVLEAIAAAGLESCRYDVDDALEPKHLSRLPVRAGDAVLVVHYFGLAQPVERLAALCRAGQVPLIEDCAHVVPDRSAPVILGSYGAMSFFSPRKQAPLPGGGVLVWNDPECRDASGAAGIGRADARTMLKLALMSVERLAVACGWNILRLKDRLPILDAYDDQTIPDAIVGEYAGGGAPSRLIAALLNRIDWQAPSATRKDNYSRIVEGLRSVPGLHVPIPLPGPGSVPLSVPIWVGNADGVARTLRRHGIEAMRWPGREQTPFDPASYPGAAAWRDRTVCLPLGIPLSADLIQRVLTAVERAVAVRPGIESEAGIAA